MARKSNPADWKKGKGVSLAPALWERIERVADAQAKSTSQVIEDGVSFYLSAMEVSRKSEDTTQAVASDGELLVALP